MRDEAAEVRRAKERDSTVWAVWHDLYYPMVYRYAFVRLSNQQDAEDLASQVFLEALKGIERFTYQGRPVIAWLYGIAHNLVLKRRRDLARAPRPLESAEGHAGSILDEGESTDARLMVWSVLDGLKEEHREVLILRYLMDLPTKEVAAVIGKTEQATYSLQVRALEAAHRALDADRTTRAAASAMTSRRDAA